MCTLAIYFRRSEAFPLVVAANRDEFYDRQTHPPDFLGRDPWVVAGQDLVAGGTWLGVNEYALVAGILNRRTGHPPDPALRSRGILCLQALAHRSAARAADAVPEDAGTTYNGFNLLIASPREAWVIGNAHGSLRRTPLSPGLHLLTNLDLNDFTCPRIAKSHALFERAAGLLEADDFGHFRSRVRDILSDHSTPLDPRSPLPPNNLCVHTEHFGTRSSSVIVYDAREKRVRLWHAEGPPCENDYTEFPLPALDNRPPTG